MAPKPRSKKRNRDDENEFLDTPPQSKAITIVTVSVLFLVGIFMLLGLLGSGGVVGAFLYTKIAFAGFGYVGTILPFVLLYTSIALFSPKKLLPRPLDMAGWVLIILSVITFLELITPAWSLGGSLGNVLGSGVVTLLSRVGGIIVSVFIGISATLWLVRDSFSIVEFIKDMFEKEPNDIYADFEDEHVLDNVPEEIPAGAFEQSIEQQTVIQPVEPKAKPIPLPEESFIPDLVNFSEDYVLPPLSLLSKSIGKPSVGDIRARGNIIKQTLTHFGIDVEMDEVSIGPTVTRYAMKPAQGIKLTRIVALKQDLSLALAAHPIRIEAPIPGKSLVGIELPNTIKSSVGLGTLLEDDEFQSSSKRLLVALGKGVTGKSYFQDIGKMPHLLIAGTTGSGKSVTVHNLIMSLLYRNTPDELRFIMVDPKRVELTLYNDIPHLLTPVIKEPKKAILALKWTAKEMERRYDILEKHSCRDIKSYHENIVYPAYADSIDSTDVLPEKMPYIVVIIDELADIMQAYPRELESAIVRLAQMSRATGIHLVLSTQRPSVNVITGLIKANIPSRLALQVASQIDSRTILDSPGAESLLGAGDMLYLGAEMSKPERMQAAWIPEEEIKKVVSFIKKKNPSLSDHIVMSETLEDEKSIVGINFDGDQNDDDPLYEDAKRAVIDAGKASTSYLQRRLKVGYSRAARLIDLLEENGIIGSADGARPREILSSTAVHHDPFVADDTESGYTDSDR